LSLPHASRILPALLAARSLTGHLLLGLDYDGTLTPIVERPEAAHLPPAAAAALAGLAARPDTELAVLSGRALADVRARVGVAGIYYAGNHGLEIVGPGLERVHPGALATLPALREAASELGRALEAVAGVQIEEKGVSLSVHYRRVAAGDRTAVRERALRIGRARPGLRCTEGKMVVELRPEVAWHKGEALSFIRRALAHGEAGPVVFVGDDRTDEDAFRAVGDNGYGIVVAPVPPTGTAAKAFLASPLDVLSFIRQLAGENAA